MICVSCQTAKTQLRCGSCESPVCKNCAQILDEGTFSFLPQRPKKLIHDIYCNNCFDQHIAADLESYNQTMELAKAVHIFDKTQGKETRLMKRRPENRVVVENCTDPDEAVLRLAFMAVQSNCNAVVDVDISATKVKDGSYSKRMWRATGISSQFRTK